MNNNKDLPFETPRNLYTTEDVVERLHEIHCPITTERLVELATSGYAPCFRWTFNEEQGPPLFEMSKILNWVKKNYLTKHDGIKFPTNMTVLCPTKAAHAHTADDGLPTALTTLSGKLFLLDGLFAVGVYFLVNEDDVVYVGQSTNVMSRIAAHRNDGYKVFDRSYLLPVPQSELLIVEAAFIKALKPKYNGNGNCDTRCGNIDVSVIIHYSPDLARMVFGPDAHMATKQNKPWPPPKYKETNKKHEDFYLPVVCWNCGNSAKIKNLVWDHQKYAHCQICGTVLICNNRKNKTNSPSYFLTVPDKGDEVTLEEKGLAVALLDNVSEENKP